MSLYGCLYNISDRYMVVGRICNLDFKCRDLRKGKCCKRMNEKKNLIQVFELKIKGELGVTEKCFNVEQRGIFAPSDFLYNH